MELSEHYRRVLDATFNTMRQDMITRHNLIGRRIRFPKCRVPKDPFHEGHARNIVSRGLHEQGYYVQGECDYIDHPLQPNRRIDLGVLLDPQWLFMEMRPFVAKEEQFKEVARKFRDNGACGESNRLRGILLYGFTSGKFDGRFLESQYKKASEFMVGEEQYTEVGLPSHTLHDGNYGSLQVGLWVKDFGF